MDLVDSVGTGTRNTRSRTGLGRQALLLKRSTLHYTTIMYIQITVYTVYTSIRNEFITRKRRNTVKQSLNQTGVTVRAYLTR